MCVLFSTSQSEYLINFAVLFDKSNTYAVNNLLTFSERLRFIAEKYNLSFSDFALKLGIPKPTLHGYWNEGREPKLSFFESFANKFPEEDVEWLITGRSHLFDMKADYETLQKKYHTVVDEELALYKRLDALMQENAHLKATLAK